MPDEHRIAVLRRLREALRHREDSLADMRLRLDQSAGDPRRAEGYRERVANDERSVAKLRDDIAQLEDDLKRLDIVERNAADPRNVENGTDFGPAAGVEAEALRHGAFREAQRCLEEHLRDGLIQTSDADRIDGVLRGPDRLLGVDARYVAAVSQPAYRSAFLKLLTHGAGASLRMTGEEMDAVQQVTAADEFRAMNTGTGSAGQFGLPLAIDPTMIISSAGTISPIRELASHVTISTREYRAVTTAGVTATFAAELTEVADGTPTLAQPDIFTEKAQAFVPFSIEVGADYPGLLDELGKLFADAKNVLEGTKFALGSGHSSNEPQGLVTGLSGTSIYTTASAGTWAVADAYGIQNSLSPRWQANARWLMSLSIYNATKRLVASASSTEPQIVSPDGRLLLNKEWRETSDMATAVAASNKIAIYGSISDAFRIVDRIGMSVELVPHIFGSSNRFPLGARGLYSFWRTSSAVIVNDAARVVSVHT
jgi:HK97 family phage major capsid protein